MPAAATVFPRKKMPVLRRNRPAPSQPVTPFRPRRACKRSRQAAIMPGPRISPRPGTAMSMFSKDNNPLGDREALARHIHLALAVERPAGMELELGYRLIKRLFNPMILGAENIPDRPCLFVGNHSLFALDGWVLGPLMLKELNRFPRGLGDKFLFANAGVGDFILKRGTVMGHPEVCSALMAPIP